MVYALCFFGGSIFGAVVMAFIAGARTLEIEQEAYRKGLGDRGHF